ncbi:MAG: TetR family transcriptional regulator [Phormidesmis sp. RL_2_1]|nr:TetR family transcriptional regulator [Phormidesmis sp. RL_2_1]
MTSKKTYHHGDLREALIAAALIILKTKDAKSLSLREVARQAGVSHTAPYRHFADKSALLAAVAEEGFIEFGQYLQAAVTPDNPLQSLQATGEAYVQYALDYPTHFRLMFSGSPPQCDSPESLQIAANKTFQTLVEVILAGQALGVMKAGNADELALAPWALVHGLAMLLLDGMLPGTEEMTMDLVRSVIAGNISGIKAGIKAGIKVSEAG